jgi:hypothetical protein
MEAADVFSDAMIARRTTHGFSTRFVHDEWVGARTSHLARRGEGGEHVCAAAPGDSDGGESDGCGSRGGLR